MTTRRSRTVGSRSASCCFGAARQIGRAELVAANATMPVSRRPHHPRRLTRRSQRSCLAHAPGTPSGRQWTALQNGAARVRMGLEHEHVSHDLSGPKHKSPPSCGRVCAEGHISPSGFGLFQMRARGPGDAGRRAPEYHAPEFLGGQDRRSRAADRGTLGGLQPEMLTGLHTGPGALPGSGTVRVGGRPSGQGLVCGSGGDGGRRGHEYVSCPAWLRATAKARATGGKEGQVG